MSDLALSPPAPAALSSSREGTGSFAFLVHSQETLPNNLPYKVDDKPMARQKRRRTSPEDQALLEAEYLRDSKPDKAARMAIVSRVALGEKEVQIWFQNRRQTTRRKSKPLLPHESSFRSSFGSNISEDTLSSSFRSEDGNFSVLREPSSFSSDSLPPNSTEEVDLPSMNASSAIHKEDQHVDKPVESAKPTNCLVKDACVDNVTNNTKENKTTPQATGYLSNRRLGSDSKSSDVVISKPGDLPNGNTSHATLHRSSSGLRISLSLEGKAKVISSDGISPAGQLSSPPAQGVKRTLQRSQSTSTLLNKSTVKGNVGRSWDARTWEFFCEKNKVDALDAMATLERSGSAAGAISLIRSRSNQALNSNPHKRNAQSTRVGSSKRVRAEYRGEKPGLVRASSSVARLQSNRGEWQKGSEQQKKSATANRKDDSDKENWLPGTELAPNRQQRTFKNQKVELLKENRTAVTYGGDLGVEMKSHVQKLYKRQRPTQILIHEDDDEAVEPAEKASQQTPELFAGDRVEEDLDCVQNLLSLSQGNWR